MLICNTFYEHCPSFLVLNSVTSTKRFPLKWFICHKNIHNPISYIFIINSGFCCPGFIAVVMVGPSSNQLLWRFIHATLQDSLCHKVFYKHLNTRSIFATKSLLCSGGITHPLTFQGLSSVFFNMFLDWLHIEMLST